MLSLLKESNLLQKLSVTLCAVTLFVISSSAWSADTTNVIVEKLITGQLQLNSGPTKQ